MKNKQSEFFFIFAIVAAIYLITSADVANYNQLIVPRGDPFTYTNSWLNIVNVYKTDYFHHLFEAFFKPSSWYMFQTQIITLLSPILSPDPVSIALVNFVVVFFSCLVIHASVSALRPSSVLPWATVCLFLLMPWHYGLVRAISLYALQLDTAYINLLFAMCFLCVVSVESGQTKFRILLGITAGLAVWSRSNAPVMIFTCVGAIATTWILSGRKSFKEVFLALAGPFLIFAVMAGFYYAHFIRVVLSYYAPLREMASNERMSLDFLLNAIKTVPGTFIVGEGQSLMAISFFSYASHFIIVITIIFTLLGLRKKKADISDLLLLSGSAVYGSVLFVFFVLFHTKDSFFYQPYAPLLIGLFIVLVGYLFKILQKTNKYFEQVQSSKYIKLAVFFFVIISAYTVNSYGTRIPNTAGADNAKFVSMVANNPETYIGSGRVAFLWYAMYNTPIFSYYRKLYGNSDIEFNNLNAKFSFYSNKYWSDLWIPTSRKDGDEVRRAIRLTLEEADIFVVPQDFACYQTADPYPLYRNHDILLEEINSFPARLYATGILKDAGCNLLVLSKRNEKTLLSASADSTLKCNFCK